MRGAVRSFLFELPCQNSSDLIYSILSLEYLALILRLTAPAWFPTENASFFLWGAGKTGKCCAYLEHLLASEVLPHSDIM